MEVPFNILKKDIPMDLVRYIKRHVVEKSQRKGVFNEWATKTLKMNNRVIKRMQCAHDIDWIYRLAMDNRM
eukprot:2983713-Ditylum_brightwellii.AAC.1